MITLAALLNIVLILVVFGLIVSVIWWALGALSIPEPLHKVIRALLIVIVVIFLVSFLLSLVNGHTFLRW